MQQPLVFNVQRFSLHDGPGIRTTVFFKGCPLRCAWCHNPESQRFCAEEIHRPELCRHCGCCQEGCVHGARETVGKAYEPGALARLIMQDRQLYETSSGGVTISGGEPLAQDTNYLIELLTALKRRGIHTAIDTSGYAEYARIEQLMPHVDLWLFDFKALDDDVHVRFTGVTNEQIRSNLSKLSGAGANIRLRVPVVPGVNDDAMPAMAGYAREHANAKQVNLLPYHKLGQNKLGEANYFDEPTPAKMAEIRDIWRDAGFDDVKIGG